MEYTPRRLRLEKEKRKKTLSHQASKVLLLLCLVFVVWLVLGQAQKLIIGRLAKTVQADYGELEEIISISAIIARQELVYTAPVSGRVQATVKEGQRVPKGHLLAKVVGEGSNLQQEKPDYDLVSAKSGVVCFHIDGLEHVITPSSLLNLDEKSLREHLEEVNNEPLNPELVNSGAPLFKVINNLQPLVVDFKVPQGAYEETPEVGDEIDLRLPGDSRKWPAKITKLAMINGELRITAESREHPSQLLHQRLSELELIKGIYKGHIIPKSALARKDEEEGVYTSFAGGFRFETVELKGQVGEQLVVSGLDSADEILVNPGIMGAYK